MGPLDSFIAISELKCFQTHCTSVPFRYAPCGSGNFTMAPAHQSALSFGATYVLATASTKACLRRQNVSKRHLFGRVESCLNTWGAAWSLDLRCVMRRPSKAVIRSGELRKVRGQGWEAKIFWRQGWTQVYAAACPTSFPSAPLRAYPSELGQSIHELYHTELRSHPHGDLRVNTAPDPVSSERDLFSSMPVGDIWPDANLLPPFKYLYSSRQTRTCMA